MNSHIFLAVTLFLSNSCGDVASNINNILFKTKEDAKELVGPYVQNVGSDHAVVAWETRSHESGSLSWRDENGWRSVSATESIDLEDGNVVHHVRVENLSANTEYQYFVHSGKKEGTTFTLKTAPSKGDRKSFEFFVYSDCQMGPDVHQSLVNDVLVPRANGRPLSDAFAFGLVAGDIVQNGDEQNQFRSRFFHPIANIASEVPYYVAIGNHENNSPSYFNYMNLPSNGTPGFDEHWYSFTYGNAHIIGLDSNSNYQIAEQIDWLRSDLESVCHDPDIDLVFSFFHHPHHSEIWPEGESEYSGRLIAEMESFLKSCDKGGAYFFGHTHAYARGQSRDVPLHHINVGSAGGELDKWGEYEHRDYPEFEVSKSEFGVVTIKVNPEGEIGFKGERLSLGNHGKIGALSTSDTFTWNQTPNDVKNLRIESIGDRNYIAAIADSPLVQKVSTDDHSSHELHWQSLNAEGEVLEESWQRRTNIFWNIDTVKSSEFGRFHANHSEHSSVQLRVRNSNLNWGEWQTQ